MTAARSLAAAREAITRKIMKLRAAWVILAAAGNARSLSNLVGEPSNFSKDFKALLAGLDYTAVKIRQ